MSEARPLDILLIEDNELDVYLTETFLRKNKVPCNLNVATNGEAALEILRHGCEEKKVPDIVFLDINLPKKDGRQVLREMKSDDCMKNIPVVMLTSSPLEFDLVDTYKLHPDCYIRKSLDVDKFNRAIAVFDTLSVRPLDANSS